MKTPRKAVADAPAAKPAIVASQSDEAAVPAAQGAAKAEDGDGQAVTSTTGRVTGLTPTKDPVRNAYGLELDWFGLPVNGPARVAVLARMEVSDPALQPGDWDFRGQERAAEVMESIYG